MTPIYQRNVVGTWLIGFILVIAVFMFAVIGLADDTGRVWWTPAIVLVMPLLFGVMRLTVTQRDLKIRFWLGFPWRTVRIEDIDAYRVVRSRKETGLGVRLKPERGDFVTCGPTAVNILLRNGRTLLVGTPEPERLVKALDKARKRAGLEE